MKTAAAVVKALSRPASQKSEAWSKGDPESGSRKPSTVEEIAKMKAVKAKKDRDELEAILEEELETDNFKGPEPVGCWTRFVNAVSSKLLKYDTFYRSRQ